MPLFKKQSYLSFMIVLLLGWRVFVVQATTDDIESPEYWKAAQQDLAKLGDGYLVWESRRTGTWQIWTVQLDGNGLRQLTPVEKDRNQKCPQISPDGTRVAFLSETLDESGPSPLHLLNRDGSTSVFLQL